MEKHSRLLREMIAYEQGCPERVHHLLKVHGFAVLIGELEGIGELAADILAVASIVHDIGIKPSLEKYGNDNGKYQEQEGPPLAEELLRRLEYGEELVRRVSYLVGHHHTYDSIDGDDYQILVEADFLVNIYENGLDQESAMSIGEKVFKTKTGTALLQEMYGSGSDGK